MTVVEYIQEITQLSSIRIQNTLELLSQDCTIPFIARYRKDKTQNLDEIAIETIAKLQSEFNAIQKRKETILNEIQQQNKLTPELQHKIDNSFNINELEDIYLPFKKKRKTKADTARENGLEPLAKMIMSQKITNIPMVATQFISEKIPSENQAIDGALHIIAQWINEHLLVRKTLRRIFSRKAMIVSKEIESEKEKPEAQKFQQYFDWSEPLNRMVSHRLLAILRAENEGFIKLKMEIDTQEIFSFLESIFIKNPKHETATLIQKAIKDSYKRLLEPSISNETLQNAKNKADDKAILVFAENLVQLLLAAPLGEKRILGIDPGYKTGCKVVCLSEQGNLLHNETIFPHAPQNELLTAMKKIRSLVDAYKIEAIAIGNGTASRETEAFIKKIRFDKDIQVFVVSEAGASVYSASAIAREEFPQYDVTVRGAISIGRRLSDPLAELVKIDPKAIGVGQYQHDVNQTKLKEELDNVVIRCVNKVGVNVNTASKSLLSYVSGIGEKMAENIVKFRQENGAFLNRTDLKKVPRLGSKAYEQAVAFLRIPNGENPLDNSAVHPEAYSIVKKMANDLQISLPHLIGNKTAISQINIANYTSPTIGELYLSDVLKELEKPGLDPRKTAKVFEFDPNIKTIADVKIGAILPGIINNITDFGCFVDIGIKESGLIHISQLKNEFVANINEVVKLHQTISVEVIGVDTERKRISLKLIA